MAKKKFVTFVTFFVLSFYFYFFIIKIYEITKLCPILLLSDIYIIFTENVENIVLCQHTQRFDKCRIGREMQQ